LARHTRVEAQNDWRVLSSALPDFGSPNSPGLVSLVVCFVFTVAAIWRGVDREEIKWAAFVGAFIGAGIGLFAYLTGLVTGLY
jgi:amino acid permease